MSESIILFSVIGSALIQPILTYLVNSRCKFIKCFNGCIECERDVKDKTDDEEDQKEKTDK